MTSLEYFLSKYAYVVLSLLLGAIQFITVFTGFHPHHDGLMLGTVRILKESFLHHGSWPFNQYGSFWVIPYLGISLIIPDAYLLVAMRLLTLGYYFVAVAFSYFIAKKIFNVSTARITVILFLVARPLGLEPFPWPSSISLMLTLWALYLLIISHSQSPNKSLMSTFAAGSIVAVNVFSRAQVGLLELGAVSLFYLLAHRKKLYFFLFGVLSATTIFLCFLSNYGWLGSALSDEFLFGTLVASSESTNRSFPKTSLAIFFFLVLFSFISNRYLSQNRFILVFNLIPVILICSSTFLIFGNVGDKGQTLFGKFYVALVCFGCLISLVLVKLNWYGNNHNYILLAIFSVSSSSQLYPLFDAMHAWWGSLPSLILIAYITNLFREKYKKLIPSNVKFLIPLLFISPFFAVFNVNFTPLNHSDLGGILMSPGARVNYTREMLFFENNIPSGSSVLNLCPDSRIFFKPYYVRTAVREFVYWPVMENVKSMNSDFLGAEPDFVIVCSEYVDSKSPVLRKFTNSPYKKDDYLQVDGGSITIFSKNK